MTDEELAKLGEMMDDKIKAALEAYGKPDTEEAEMATAAEAEAGVTEADKKPEDAKMSAALCAATRIARATKRITTAALAEYKETDIKAQAKFTAMLGRSGGGFTPAGGEEKKKLSTAKFSALSVAERNDFIRKGGKLEG